MKYELKGFSKIFAFTFRQQTRRKGFLIALILVALLCLLGPALIMTGTAYFGQNSDDAGAAQRVDLGEEAGQSQDQALGTDALAFVDEIREILVVNETDDSAYSAEALSSFDFEQITGVPLAGVTFTDLGEDFEGARRQAADTDDTLILFTSQEGSLYQMRLLIPEGSGISQEKAQALEPVLTTYGSMAADSYNAVHGLEEDGGMFDIGVHEGDADDPLAGAKSVLGFVLPYLNIMVLYFFVLIYGQSLAQSVIMEKTSKLMESFLVSVRPTAMIMGKLTAVCLCGVLQLGLWILCLIGGFYLGCVGVRAVDPDSDMLVVLLMESFGAMTRGMFSVGGIVMTLLMILAGMLLYCSLAGIGGAISGKPEDLSSANVMFTLILVASFFACLAAGGLNGLSDGAGWMDWIPFTAVLVTPSRVLLGSVSLLKGFGCLLVILAVALALTVAAGRLYKLMALYRGDVPGPKKLLQLLRG